MLRVPRVLAIGGVCNVIKQNCDTRVQIDVGIQVKSWRGEEKVATATTHSFDFVWFHYVFTDSVIHMVQVVARKEH